MSTQHLLKLNVGGTPFYTFYDTLKRYPFFEELDDQKDTDAVTYINQDEIFIDRSPELFEEILNYVRSNNLQTASYSNAKLLSLKNEALYYGMSDLVKDLDKELKQRLMKRHETFEVVSASELAKKASRISVGSANEPDNVYQIEPFHTLYDLALVVSGGNIEEHNFVLMKKP